jgi:hypothetical protein
MILEAFKTAALWAAITAGLLIWAHITASTMQGLERCGRIWESWVAGLAMGFLIIFFGAYLGKLGIFII